MSSGDVMEQEQTYKEYRTYNFSDPNSNPVLVSKYPILNNIINNKTDEEDTDRLSIQSAVWDSFRETRTNNNNKRSVTVSPRSF